MKIISTIKAVLDPSSQAEDQSVNVKAFVSIPREKSVYCLDCDTISVAQVRANAGRCGVCGGEALVSVSDLFSPSEASVAGRRPVQSDRPVAHQRAFAYRAA